MTPMQQLLNQLRYERRNLPMLIEWDRCYQAIEMVIENTYLPMETLPKQEISDEEILKEGKTMFDGGHLYAFHVGATWYREQLKIKNK